VRIGIDFRGAQSEGGSGQRGIGRYILDLVVGILDHYPQHEVVLFCRDVTRIPKELNGRCREVQVSISDPKPFWLKIPKVRSQMFLHRKLMFQRIELHAKAMESALAANPVDVLHLPSALDIGSYPIFGYPCPVVMTFLDAIVIRFKDDVFNHYAPYQQEYYGLQGSNLKLADHVVGISQSSSSDAVELFGVNPSKVSTVYPVVSDEFMESRSLGQWGSKKPYYLFCSVPDLHKNPKVVMEAFAKMRTNEHLIFISPLDQHYAPMLAKFAEELGITEHFTVTGFIDQSELIGLFQNAVALVSPSKMEGFGLPVAQAMKCGTPVVTNGAYSQGEIAHDVGFLVNPNSVEEVAEAMKQAASEPRGSARLLKGIERTKQFESKATTDQLIEIYERLISSR
jgi:glycosyltransferase involved in cell wall biosynthesis